jgi:cobalt-zinc-cadmium efflux system outer membrane protein
MAAGACRRRRLAVVCVLSCPPAFSFRTFSPYALACLLLLATARPAGAAWPSLEEVWRASRERAPGSVRAQSETWLARAEGTGARESSFHNPSLRIGADHGVGRTPVGASAGLAATGELGLPVEISGQRSARIRSVDALVAWREREQAAAEGQAGGEAVVAYGQALVARARVDLASEAEQQAASEVAWFEARTQAGDATAVDRSLAQSELARHAQSRAEAQIDLIQAEAELRALTGLMDLTEPPDEPLALPPSVGTRPARADAAASSPGIEAFARESTYWDREVETAKATRWSPIELSVSGGQDEFGQIRVGGALGWSFPLLRRNDGEIARAAAASSRARADRDALLRAVEATVNGLRERMARTVEAVTALDHAGIPAAEGLVSATDAAFRAGKLELVRVLNARRDLALMRGRRLDLVEGGWRAYGDLASILGVLP